MSISIVLDQVSEQNNWNSEDKVNVLSDYIYHQQSHLAFDDFISEKFCIDYDSASNDEKIDAMVEYIGNQKSDDAFKDFLQEQAA